MNVRFLIDRLVQLQARLLAEFATLGGVRAPLAELNDQMFIHLAEELDRRGISRKVSSDMFGMALRAYLKKIQRLAKSSTENGSSLWQAALDHLHKSGPTTRAELLQRFCHDDEGQLRAVMHDLVESGLCTCEGMGPLAIYRLEELETARLNDAATFAELIWLTIFRDGPVTREKLLERCQKRSTQLESALTQLLETGRVTAMLSPEGTSYEAPRFEIPMGQEGGFEAAILDHYQAMVGAICGVLPGLVNGGPPAPSVGGFTYSLDIWPGHPMEGEVMATLGRLRQMLSELRKRVDEHNRGVDPPSAYSEVRIYGGQSITARRTLRSQTPPPTKLPASTPPPGTGRS